MLFQLLFIPPNWASFCLIGVICSNIFSRSLRKGIWLLCAIICHAAEIRQLVNFDGENLVVTSVEKFVHLGRKLCETG